MSEHLDSHEADALESLVISEGWRVIAGRVRGEIERKRDTLEKTDMAHERMRGFLAACRMFLELPATIAAEIKQGEK